MTKRKYILSDSYIEYEEACINLFNKMSNDGWELVKVGLFFVFEKTNRKLKYQIDYTERDTEYNEIIEEIGYFYLGTCRKTHFYATEDLDAIDLVNDVVLKKQILLKQHPTWAIMTYTILGLAIIWFNARALIKTFQSIANYYLYFNLFSTYSIFLIIGIYMLITMFYEHIKRKSIENETFSYAKFKLSDWTIRFSKIILLIVLISLNYISTHSITKTLQFLSIFLLLLLINYISFYPIQKEGKKSNRSKLRIVLFIIAVFIQLFIRSWDDNSTYHNLPNTFPSTSVFSVSEDIYTYKIEFAPIEQDNLGNITSSRYIECRDEQVSSSIFEHLIIKAEEITRYPTQEEMDKIYDQTGKAWDYKDLEKKSYNESLKAFNKYENELVDECYYLDKAFIFKKDNLVARIYEEDSSKLEQHIRDLVTFYNNEPYFK